MSHGWASVRQSCSLGRYSSAIRTGCANERPSGSVRGAASNGCPYRDLIPRDTGIASELKEELWEMRNLLCHPRAISVKAGSIGACIQACSSSNGEDFPRFVTLERHRVQRRRIAAQAEVAPLEWSHSGRRHASRSCASEPLSLSANSSSRRLRPMAYLGIEGRPEDRPGDGVLKQTRNA